MVLVLIMFLIVYSGGVVTAMIVGLVWMAGGALNDWEKEYDCGVYIAERALIYPLLVYRMVRYDSIYGKDAERNP